MLHKILVVLFFFTFLIWNQVFCQGVKTGTVPDSLLTNREYLEKLLPQVIPYAANKEQLHLVDVSPDSVELLNRYPELLIGKFIDSVRTFAILYEEQDSALTFFRLQDNKWRQIGFSHFTNYYGNFQFEELNGDKNLEILACTGRNMNGNSWINLYTFSEEKDSILFAGDFCCDFEVNLAKKELYEEHAGSWYMDLYKTIYIWKNEMLVPKKHIRLTLLNPDINHKPKYEISLWDNRELEYSSKYKLIFKDRYRKWKYQKLWDNFFEQN
jgi:hypothetical protein